MQHTCDCEVTQSRKLESHDPPLLSYETSLSVTSLYTSLPIHHNINLVPNIKHSLYQLPYYPPLTTTLQIPIPYQLPAPIQKNGHSLVPPRRRPPPRTNALHPRHRADPPRPAKQHLLACNSPTADRKV